MQNKYPTFDSNGDGYFAAIDIFFARFICELDGNNDRDIFLSAALASRNVQAGSVCLDLTAVAGSKLTAGQNDRDTILCPPLAGWLDTLRASPVVGRPGEFRPLILDSLKRLYLYRYWEYENRLAGLIKERTRTDIDIADRQLLKNGFQRLFPTQNEIDWQKIAALSAVLKRFCIISGGPGTGKTFLVAKILALLLEQHHGQMDILLAAPTGKAAARLRESIVEAKALLPCAESIKAAIPTQTFTIQRLLKTIPASPYFRHNADNPLAADVVVVDEASMVDIALMSKLFDAVPAAARLILLGDRNQLASVEAGSVLDDICGWEFKPGFSDAFRRQAAELADERIEHSSGCQAATTGLQDSIVTLRKNYRFKDASLIAAFGLALNRRQPGAAFRLLNQTGPDRLEFREIISVQDAYRELAEKLLAGYGGCFDEQEPAEMLRRLSRFMILCATRTGPFGVAAMNAMAERLFRRSGRIRAEQAASGQWYPGRPVLITQNDYELDLFNGDLGITGRFDGSPDNDCYVFFQGADGTLRRINVSSLPEHETAFAITVHKSQGSEFEDILLILPDRDLSILTRELVYTAVTRARKSVTIWAREEILRAALNREIRRTSGLRESLWTSAP